MRLRVLGKSENICVSRKRISLLIIWLKYKFFTLDCCSHFTVTTLDEIYSCIILKSDIISNIRTSLRNLLLIHKPLEFISLRSLEFFRSFIYISNIELDNVAASEKKNPINSCENITTSIHWCLSHSTHISKYCTLNLLMHCILICERCSMRCSKKWHICMALTFDIIKWFKQACVP